MRINRVTRRAALLLAGAPLAGILMLSAAPASASPDPALVCSQKDPVTFCKATGAKGENKENRAVCEDTLVDITNAAKKQESSAGQVRQETKDLLGEVQKYQSNKKDFPASVLTEACALYKSLPPPAPPAPPVAPTPTVAPVAPVAPAPPSIESICSASCSAPGTFCIEATTGEAFCRGTAQSEAHGPPTELGGGDQLVVQVWGLAGVDELGTADLSSTERVSRDSTFAPTPTNKGGELHGSPRFAKILEKPFTASTSVNVQSMSIFYKWTPKDKNGVPAQHGYVISIDHGKYYLEIGILFPLVINGTRTVTPALVPGTGGERRIRVNEDSSITPALALNFFPAGRRNGRVTAFDPCRAGDLFGMQLAVDLNLKQPFERVYAGIVFEPIAGASFNAGMAMVKGDIVPRDAAEGMLVPRDETFTPDRRYLPRPYLGFTLSNEILTTITGAAQKFKAPAPN